MEAFLAKELAKKANKILPGLESFTFDQFLYISFGQKECHNESEFDPYILNDTHSPSKFHINGPLSNYELFAKTFE